MWYDLPESGELDRTHLLFNKESGKFQADSAILSDPGYGLQMKEGSKRPLFYAKMLLCNTYCYAIASSPMNRSIRTLKDFMEIEGFTTRAVAEAISTRRRPVSSMNISRWSRSKDWIYYVEYDTKEKKISSLWGEKRKNVYSRRKVAK